MIPSATLIPELIPTGMVAAAVETGLVAATLMAIVVLAGLCIALAARRPGAAEARRASLHSLSRAAARTTGQAEAA